MSRQEKVLMLAALLMAHSAASLASTVTYTVPTTASASGGSSLSYEYVFASPIDNVSALVSISGTAFVEINEGGTFNFALHTTSGGTLPIGSYTAPTSTPAIYGLSSLSNITFAKSDIDGLVFNFTGFGSSNSNVDVVQGSIFTFTVPDPAPPPPAGVPEPTTLALLGAAGLAAGWKRRRRSVASAAQPTVGMSTSE